MLDRWLFPRNQFVNFAIIAVLASVFSFLLTGQQIYSANWGLIDDHEVFSYFGPDLHLPASEIWRNLLAKSEGQVFRPTYYIIRLIEASLWGDNVHLWYLGNTICFAIFLSSIWWTMLRFVGGWLSGALTAYIALLPLWAYVWSRLGPSEIYGAACVGVMLFAVDSILLSANPIIRNAGAIALALATVALVGMKETFFPLAAGTACVFVVAIATKRLSVSVVGFLAFFIMICVGGIMFVIAKGVLANGTDLYGRSVGPWPILLFAGGGFLTALLYTWWLWVLPVAFFQMLRLLPYKPFRCWIISSGEAAGIYIFMVAMFAAQCGVYRIIFPHNSRYDFPSMLLVPLTGCVLACNVFYKLRGVFPERTINYAQMTAAIFLVFALANVHVGSAPALSIAVRKNIETTNTFHNELERLVRAGNESPTNPIILEAHGPFAYEPVFSLSIYLRALGSRNPISVRYHPDGKLKGAFPDSLQRILSDLQNAGWSAALPASTVFFTPLVETLGDGLQQCLSVGIYGPADVACSTFEIKKGL